MEQQDLYPSLHDIKIKLAKGLIVACVLGVVAWIIIFGFCAVVRFLFFK